MSNHGLSPTPAKGNGLTRYLENPTSLFPTSPKARAGRALDAPKSNSAHTRCKKGGLMTTDNRSSCRSHTPNNEGFGVLLQGLSTTAVVLVALNLVTLAHALNSYMCL
ncbi:hypothetical protein L209DRAFT_157516 [Thermothelomyces heterothallicus CBS 203.75]